MYRKLLLRLFFVLLAIAVMNLVSFAQPTEEQILDRIESGLDWLVPQQDATGAWIDPGYTAERIASTGFVLTKLCDYALEQGVTPFDPTYEYFDEVVLGFNFIFSTVRNVGPTGMCATPTALGYSNHHEIYNAAAALMAIGAAKSPGEIVPVGVAAGMTLLQLQDKMIEYFEWAQGDSSPFDGGWRYTPNGGSDNSHTGWVTLALRYAETNGSTIPVGIKSKLDAYIDYIQCTNGSSAYVSPCDWPNTLKAGNLLLEMAFVGDPVTATRVQNALSYIQNTWVTSHDPGYGDTQAMYCLLKGFESYGIEEITVGGSPRNWFDDFTTLLFSWSASGSWPSHTSTWTGELMSTSWALMVLEKVAPPPVCPDDILVDNDPGECGAVVEFDITAHYEATITQVSGLPSGSLFPVGITEQKFEIERNGEITLCEFIVEVVDVEPPNMVCTAFTAELDEFGEVTVYPEDIDGGTTDNCSFEFISEPIAFTCDDIGEQTVVLTAVDPSGNEASCTTTVTVVDLIAPTFTATTEPFLLKQNNHKYVTFSIDDFNVLTSDNCGVNTWVISRATSDEVEDGLYDGSTLNDIVISDDCQSILVREERSGNGDGRVYTVELMAVDASGNVGTTYVEIHVPHNTFYDAINSGPVYEVEGNCFEKSGLLSSNSIDNDSEGFMINTYPNPTTGKVTVNIDGLNDRDARIFVVNILGQMVFERTNCKASQIDFDLSENLPGIYFINILVDDKRVVNKINLIGN